MEYKRKKIDKLYCTDFNVFTEIYPNDGYKALNTPSNVYLKYSLDKNKVIEAAKKIMDEFGIEGNPEDHVDYWETCRSEKLFIDEDGIVTMECYDGGECYKRTKFRHCL